VKSSLQRILLGHLFLTIIFALALITANYFDFEPIVYSIASLFIIINIYYRYIVAKGLGSINSITKELASRAPNHLEPVAVRSYPSELKPVVNELNKLLARLKEGFEREKRFAADAAHELRTPLAALKVQAQVALNTHDIDEKNQALTKLIISVNRGAHIVQQLLTMSRMFTNSGKQSDIEHIDLAKIVREIMAMHAPQAVDKKIQLELDAMPQSLYFRGNPTTISILISNLIDNAIRYCREGDDILVRVFEKKKNLILEVSDTGPGIPKAFRSRVFERFFRVLGNKTQGSGLGLSIVKQICELHHGKVTLKAPKKGTGVVISVFFPADI